MNILGLDFETTGLDTQTARITEIGAIVWDTDTHQPVKLFSTLVSDESYAKQSDEVVRVSGITDEMLKKHSTSPGLALAQLTTLMVGCNFVMAHNGNNYDKPIFQREIQRQGLADPNLLWIDSSTDLPLPETMPACRKLTHLALEHGIAVHKRFCHRAFYDVLLMLEIASNYAINNIIEYASTPTIIVRAHVTFEQKDLAKAQRFNWDGGRKFWIKNIKAFDLEKEVLSCATRGFRIAVVEER